MMRVLHFSRDDIRGGAAKASYRLHSALRQAGFSSEMIVLHKYSEDPDVRQAKRIYPSVWQQRYERMRRLIPVGNEDLPRTRYMFNLDVPPGIDSSILFSHSRGDVDLICLHWITDFLTAETIRELYEHYRCPIVWVLMDQEPVTGGCHYSFDCEGYTKRCGNCPLLDPSFPTDRSHRLWHKKNELLRELPITFVAPTQWIAERVRRSSLFGEHAISTIPLPIDTGTFRPFKQAVARDLLHLPRDKKIIFFGSSSLEDPRKGMKYLVDALAHLSEKMSGENGPLKKEDVYLVVAGASSGRIQDSLPFASKHLGTISEDVVLALAYQAADVFACPSVEDAGPMMIPESMLCGTPVAAFNTGGAPDLIESPFNGYLARFKDSVDLAEGLQRLLTVSDPAQVRRSAHEVARRNHDAPGVVERYSALFHELTTASDQTRWSSVSSLPQAQGVS